MSKNIEMNIKTNDSYEVLYPNVKANSVIDFTGDNPLLTQEVAKFFGVEENWNPNKVFSYLSKYAQYWWKRKKYTAKPAYEDLTRDVDITSNDFSIQYATDVNISDSGDVTLANPQTYTDSFYSTTLASNCSKKLCSFAPCYLKGLYGDSTGIYYLPEGSTYSEDDSFTKTTVTYTAYRIIGNTNSGTTPLLKKVSAGYEYGTSEYVYSNDRHTYPDYGRKDGYEYEYLGIPYDNAVNAPKTIVGNYVGNGLSGASKPTTLALPFAVKLVIIYGSTLDAANPTYNPGYTILINPSEKYSTLITDGAVNATGSVIWDGNTVKFWSTESKGADGAQFNVSGETYYYFAVK